MKDTFIGVITQIGNSMVNGNTMYSFRFRVVSNPERWSSFSEPAASAPQLDGIFSAAASVSPHLPLASTDGIYVVEAESKDAAGVRKVVSFAPWNPPMTHD